MQEPLDDADSRCDLHTFYHCIYLPSLFFPYSTLLLHQQCTILFLFTHKPQMWNREVFWKTRLLHMFMKLERTHQNWFDSTFPFCLPVMSVGDFVQQIWVWPWIASKDQQFQVFGHFWLRCPCAGSQWTWWQECLGPINHTHHHCIHKILPKSTWDSLLISLKELRLPCGASKPNNIKV